MRAVGVRCNGYGGSCFPKDSLALKQLAANSGYHFHLMNAVIEVNELQKRRVLQKLQRHLGKRCGPVSIAPSGMKSSSYFAAARYAPSSARTREGCSVPNLGDCPHGAAGGTENHSVV